VTAQTDERVYAAENDWLQMMTLADNRGGVIRYQGEEYLPEGFVRFSGIDDIAAYVAKVLAHIGRDADAIHVVDGRGGSAAHFDYFRQEIQIPKREKGGAWALNSAVVLHEVAHYLSPANGHTRPFRLAFVRLLEDLGQVENARLLQACFSVHSLSVLKADTTEATIARIGKVLRQAEAASTEEERATFLAKAQEMATRHSVTLATARAHQARKEERAAPVARSYKVGAARQRGLVQLIHLIMGISSTNDVKFTIYGDNSGVTMYGFVEDIDLTIALYESIRTQMVTDCEAYLATDEWRGERVWSEKQFARVPITKITARLAFNDAYQRRIGHRMAEAQRAARKAVETEKPEVGTALILRDKAVEVREAYAVATRTIKRSWSGGKVTGSERAFAAGDRAARSASIGAEKQLTPTADQG
jgi:putative metallohydrolase (TIGR04338 family)